MHDSTVKMENTTGKVEKHSESIDNQTGELYDALRQGDALQSRRTALANLINAKDPLRKLSEAAKYFMAFEVQLWNTLGPDANDGKRTLLATVAAREFFKDIAEFIPDGKMEPKPFAGQIFATQESNLVNSFNALAATLHYINPKQEVLLAQRKDLKAISMYQIIEESLLAKTEIESGKKKISDYPGYVTEVLFSEKEAVYLLQARYNYLPALIIGKVSNAANSKIAAAMMIASRWNLDLSKLNSVQLEELNKFLLAAAKTRDLLVQIGETPKTDKLLLSMLKNAQVKSTDKAVSLEKVNLDKEFTENLKELTDSLSDLELASPNSLL
jgi:hypothetical protein